MPVRIFSCGGGAAGAVGNESVGRSVAVGRSGPRLRLHYTEEVTVNAEGKDPSSQDLT